MAVVLAGATFCLCAGAVDVATGEGWRPLFNGTNFNGWHVVISDSKSDDPAHLVQIDAGTIHMYKDAVAESLQPPGYLVTDKEYSNYRVRLEYKWGTKKFAPRLATPRDAGLMYHITGKDFTWPNCVECQIEEGDTGDIWTIHTRVTAVVDPKTTSTNQIPVFLDPAKGGVSCQQGAFDGKGDFKRFIRSPKMDHEGWNTVAIEVHGGQATYIINGTVNNRVKNIEQFKDGAWVPLNQGGIGLQLEYSEVYYRNIEIQELKP